jgi:thioredoxin reductase (NADPH)
MEQAQGAGATFLDEDVIETRAAADGFKVRTEGGRTITCRSLILAMGVTRNRLGVPGEKQFLGRGVSYCVDCDANFFRNKDVAVVGGGSAAAAGSLTLLFYAASVHLVTEEIQISEQLIHQLQASQVQLHLGRSVREIVGSDKVQALLLDNDERLAVSGVFIETGAKGAVELAAGLGVALDDEKFRYIVTDKQQQTNIPGIFAAGDICGPPWQVAKAVGEGCVAGLAAARYAKQSA